MASPTVWKNVGVTMQSALGTAKTITAITKANPGVASSTSHGLSNGAVVYLEIEGMRQADAMAVRVANVDTDTFELEGVDTTLFDTFTSGTAKEVTFGTSVVTITTLSASGGTPEMIDYTTIHDDRRREQPGLPSATSYTMENLWDPTDTGLIAMYAATLANERRVFGFQFGTGGKKMYFSGYISCNLIPGGGAQQLATTPSTATIHGNPTYYSS